jgi:hypothetical protein
MVLPVKETTWTADLFYFLIRCTMMPLVVLIVW